MCMEPTSAHAMKIFKIILWWNHAPQKKIYDGRPMVAAGI